ncbi:phosphomannomutase/phosphoglucomutase [Sulfurimonas sp. HSL1-2]|uniref:phosphomannomutase/phosphoglucomutase n=1 Tax=Thiomicrolovo zhangzhouensis TaxID=3131933 RepID=UPI0031F8FD3E
MSIFREYDIRGIVPGELNEESVTKIGFALAGKIDGEYVAVGYDARTHSPELFGYLAAGLNAGGKTVLAMGLVPTPVNYFANYQEFKVNAGGGEGPLEDDWVTPSASVMITGSHNPIEYNGFKITVTKAPFFGEQIYALGDEVAAMELPPKSEAKIIEIDVKARYIDYMVEQFSHLKGMKEKIVYDCGNGAAGVIVPEIFACLELDAGGLYVEPDGTFPNHHPDPSIEVNLSDVKSALEAEGDVAIAYDGDADRVVVLTRKRKINGDQMALLFSMGMNYPTVIGDVKCSQVMFDTLKARGATAVMYKTGHSNLKAKIKELDADLACEMNGHFFFNDRYFGYDDAIYATLRMLELVQAGIDLDEELDRLPRVFSTEEIQVETTEQEKFPLMAKLGEMLQHPPADFPAIREIITVDGVRVIFENGWGLVRASNTTPVLVTRFESPDLEDAKRYEKALNDLIAEARAAL